MKQFNLSEWLKDKSRKVVTRDGKEVRIICWDVKSSQPIVALVSTRSISQLSFDELIINYFNNGTYYGEDKEASLDLFFADEENELTEFENKLSSVISEVWQDYLLGREIDIAEVVKEYSSELLDLARNEILKDLPKWQKATEHEDLEKHIAILEEDKVLLSNYLEEGDYYIELDDLKTLPKE